MLLRQDAVECRNKVTHRCFAVALYHIIDSLDMVDVILLGNGPNMGLI